MQQPHIVGVRHHSPACARLVAERIRTLRPAYVLIEGPADFNERLDELYLPHRLPVAIYSYLSGDQTHRGSWSPFAEHSPEWQALQVAREVGAAVRFIDLPAWHDAFSRMENRYADVADHEHEERAEAYERALTEKLSVQGRDALWDHLFEDGCDAAELSRRLSTYFDNLRGEDRGSQGNQAREAMMARWIAWAMAQPGEPGRAQALVVCGGYHAPALARLWQGLPAGLPETPQPSHESAGDEEESGAPLRFGSYLVPYTFKRLDAFAGYASGMPSPAYYQWMWDHGPEGAAHRALQHVMQRLRDKKLPASTADLMAVHLRAQGLARLRGHDKPLRSDWLDALAGALVKDALDAPLPWTYRGAIRPGTDPVLVQAMDVLAGDTVGLLAPGTPQPPLVAAVQAELAAHGIALRGQLKLDLLAEADRAKSRVLHRLAILRLPGVRRTQGPKLAMSGERTELWSLGEPLEQQAALIEAGAWGASLHDAARARLEDDLRQAQGRIGPLADGLNQAAWAGLSALSEALLRELRGAIAGEPRFEALGPALSVLHTLLRHGQMLGMADAPVLRVVIESGFDRALWLLEPPAAIGPADMQAHLEGHLALRRIVADVLAHAQDNAHDAHAPSLLDVEPARALAVWQRKAADASAAPVSRGAALGASLSLAGRFADAQTHEDHGDHGVREAMQLLHSLPAPVLGDALTGLLALARETLASEPAFVAGMDRTVQALDNADFVRAMPSLRAAFAWLPPQERGLLADQVLTLHDATHLSRCALTAHHAGEAAPEQLAEARRVEDAVLARLAAWGVTLEDSREEGPRP
ncbi:MULTISPECIES: DUF5682 family protein [unclassified Variovorax]|jgi:hypothetical protein|uniref:DUF5682 family protein n=1 Tax=unclassified Variovorax TaxID=663243 RepID=UPI000F7E4504|nr:MULTISPECIES: DUF5682 family protein [unclassified Variovorax]RSZ45747.1 hypothetical protein EJO70_04610 [Variovorax sp. 553]RSZ46798.1 hypothetical protein EJO71_06700 [Variovorax sp. 679]